MTVTDFLVLEAWLVHGLNEQAIEMDILGTWADRSQSRSGCRTILGRYGIDDPWRGLLRHTPDFSPFTTDERLTGILQRLPTAPVSIPGWLREFSRLYSLQHPDEAGATRPDQRSA